MNQESTEAMNQEHKETYAEYVWREPPTPEVCDHMEDGYDSLDEGLVYVKFTYCPKCGEKL